MTEINLTPPTQSGADQLHSLIKAVLPGPAALLFSEVFQSPYEERLNEWYEKVAQNFVLFNERLIRTEDLLKKPAFIDAVFQATRIAIANSEKEKIEALQNALFNVGMNSSPDRALQQIYFSHIDVFSALHLKILKLAKSLPEAFKNSMNEFSPGSGFSAFLDTNLPELKNNKDVRDVIWSDLYSKKLVKYENFISGHSLITEHGSNFVSFIENHP
jgi:hypothetical protein